MDITICKCNDSACEKEILSSTNKDLAEMLGISQRTLQRLRSSERIGYKIILGRCYYDLKDIEEAIRKKSLYCNPQNIKELRRNFLLKTKRTK